MHIKSYSQAAVALFCSIFAFAAGSQYAVGDYLLMGVCLALCVLTWATTQGSLGQERA